MAVDYFIAINALVVSKTTEARHSQIHSNQTWLYAIFLNRGTQGITTPKLGNTTRLSNSTLYREQYQTVFCES